MTAVKVQVRAGKLFSLTNVRLCFYGLALLNLLVTALVTLSIDLTVEEDPAVRAYSRSRWLLLTCWFNMISIFYILLCIYCNWREKNGDHTPLLDRLRALRDVIMTSILFPVTAYSDLIFWVLYKSYPWIIAPPRVLELVPYWAQHSLHTVSFVFVLMDLILTPRLRPTSDKTNLGVLYGFSIVYSFAMFVSYLYGLHLYGFLTTSSRIVCIQTFVYSLFLVTVFYYAQWVIVEYVWGQKASSACSKKNDLKVE